MDEREREQWRQADRLFESLIELDEPARAAALRAAAAAPEVHSKVERLLAASRRSHRLLDSADSDPAWRNVAAANPHGDDRMVGRCIGGWRLVELLGRGGMAAVYRAVRTGQDFDQAAAVKLLDTALHGNDVRERFRRERRILAQLQHPHIAGLLDAGVDAGDTAYLVMTLVAGVRIDDYCEAQRLSTRARIELMMQVCAAVAYAHRQLVIHRDLKPGNILVDSGGHAMLLDFGIARLLESDDATEGTVTRAFTPDYASPEQRAGARGLGTAVDVYGLGAVLHRLLAGAPPRLDARGEALPASACARDKGRMRDARVLRGDLDAIVACALAADPQRRYASAAALADDLGAWLRHRPVVARRSGAWNRLGKFVRRNRAASVLALTTIVATAAGLVAFAASHRALRQRAAELQTVTKFQADMLDRLDPGAVGGRLHAALAAELQRASPADAAALAAIAHIDYAGLAVDLLDGAVLQHAVESARSDFAAQPRVEALLLQSLASIYRNLGRLDAAAPLQDKAVALLRGTLGPGDPLTLASVREQLKLVRARNAPDGEARHREALALHEHWLGADAVDTALARAALGQWLMEHGKAADAELLLRASAARIEAARGRADPDAVAGRANLAYAISQQGRYAESEPHFRQALADATKAFGPDHAYTLTIANNLAWVLNRLGRAEAAEALYRKVYDARRRTLGADHRSTLISLNNLAVQLRRRGALADAEPLQRQAFDGLRETLGPQDAATLHAGMNLAQVLVARDEHAQAAVLLQAELGAWRARGDKPAIAQAERLLARTYAAMDRRAAAQRALMESWDAASALDRRDEARKTAQALVDFYDGPDGDPQQHSRWIGELQRLAPAKNPGSR